MKKSFFASIILCLGLVFTSCLSDEENYTYYKSLAVVYYHDYIGGIGISTNGQVYAAPELEGQGLQTGDCIYANYKVDYDNQPHKEYQTATEISYIKYDKHPFNRLSENMDLNNTDLVSAATLTVASNASVLPTEMELTSAQFRGNAFLTINHLGSENIKYDYNLYYSPDLVTEQGVYNLYLTAKKNGTIEKRDLYYPFDMNRLITECGRDSTVVYQGENYVYKYVRVNLNYPKVIDSDTGNPIYDKANSNPIVVAVYK